jgi:hypothetical protein
MGQEALVAPNVEGARRLVQLMDEAGAPPVAVLWVHEAERDEWRLWIAPSRIPGSAETGSALRAFYGFIASLVVKHRAELAGLDPGDVAMVAADHPAIRGLSGFVRAEAGRPVVVSNQMLNGYFLPHAVVIRIAAPKAA